MGSATINKDFLSYVELINWLDRQVKAAERLNLHLECAYIDKLTNQNKYNLRAIFRK